MPDKAPLLEADARGIEDIYFAIVYVRIPRGAIFIFVGFMGLRRALLFLFLRKRSRLRMRCGWRWIVLGAQPRFR